MTSSVEPSIIDAREDITGLCCSCCGGLRGHACFSLPFGGDIGADKAALISSNSFIFWSTDEGRTISNSEISHSGIKSLTETSQTLMIADSLRSTTFPPSISTGTSSTAVASLISLTSTSDSISSVAVNISNGTLSTSNSGTILSTAVGSFTLPTSTSNSTLSTVVGSFTLPTSTSNSTLSTTVGSFTLLTSTSNSVSSTAVASFTLLTSTLDGTSSTAVASSTSNLLSSNRCRGSICRSHNGSNRSSLLLSLFGEESWLVWLSMALS